ncbi:MAG: hypothetical protein ACM3O4_05370 [Ignavibacteriales bacterium]
MSDSDKEKQYDDTQPTYENVHETFVKLIGYITYILKFDSYKESYIEYSDILSKISMWAVNYEKSHDLSFINPNELNEIYERVDNLQTKYICNDNMGSESEFSDYVVNWMWHLILFNKKIVHDKYVEDIRIKKKKESNYKLIYIDIYQIICYYKYN